MAGYALMLVDERRQGLQDKIAHTTVLYAVEGAIPRHSELDLDRLSGGGHAEPLA